MPNLQLERLKALPVHSTTEVWEVAACPVPARSQMTVDGPLEQLIACVCVSNQGGAALADPQSVVRFSDTTGIDALARFALSPLGPGEQALNYLPARVHVGPMPEDAQHLLASALTELGVEVEIKGDIDLSADFFEGLGAHLASQGNDNARSPVEVPALMSVQGMSVERIAAFADAARVFWDAKPWRRFEDEMIWRITPAPETAQLRYCTVMGGGGTEFGLGFMADPSQALEMSMAGTPSDYLQSVEGAHWGITFDTAQDVPAADARLWHDHKLPLTAPDAFPFPIGFTRSKSVLRPSPANLTLLEGLLRAFAPLKRTEVAAGRFVREVGTFEGKRTLTLEAVEE